MSKTYFGIKAVFFVAYVRSLEDSRSIFCHLKAVVI
jgi:hypothetical protein